MCLRASEPLWRSWLTSHRKVPSSSRDSEASEVCTLISDLYCLNWLHYSYSGLLRYRVDFAAGADFEEEEFDLDDYWRGCGGVRRRLFPFLSSSYLLSYLDYTISIFCRLSSLYSNLLSLVHSSSLLLHSSSLSIPSSPLFPHSRHTHRTLLPKAPEPAGLVCYLQFVPVIN